MVAMPMGENDRLNRLISYFLKFVDYRFCEGRCLAGIDDDDTILADYHGIGCYLVADGRVHICRNLYDAGPKHFIAADQSFGCFALGSLSMRGKCKASRQ